MPITFGSVGDIISVSLLIKDLLVALDGSRGSSSSYRAIVRELYTLDSALLHVDQLSRTQNATPELHALCVTARQTVDRCRTCIDKFKQKIQKYRRSLAAGGSGNVIADVTRKIQWSVSEQEHMASFRAELTGYTESINMLIATASVILLDVNNDKLNNCIKDTERQTAASQQLALTEIRRRLDENNQLIRRGNSIAAKATERLEWVKQLGLQLRTLIYGVMAGNFRIYKEVIAVQKMLTGHISRSLAEDPFILEDAIGRIAPVHLRFITSWDAFEAVLQLRFKNTMGSAKVHNREYILQEHATGREINRTTEWDLAFLPGQKIDMSMVFKVEAGNEEKGTKRNEDPQSASCPYCLAVSDKPTKENIQCRSCQRWYQRVLEEEDEPQTEPLPNQSKTQVQLGGAASPSNIVFRPTPAPKRKANHIDTETENEVDFKPFKRIRLINRRKRAKILGLSNATSLATATTQEARPKGKTTVASNEDNPAASGLLLMLLLSGAHVVSKSSGGPAPHLPRMPDEVRAASATLLDSIFKDAGITPTLERRGPPGVDDWQNFKFAGFPASSTASTVDEEENEPIFSITPAQYNSMASMDSGRPYDTIGAGEVADFGNPVSSSSPNEQPSPSPAQRRNLAETLASLREGSKGENAVDIYTRSLLWDTIAPEVVHEFKRMVEESAVSM